MKTDIKSLTYPELVNETQKLGLKPFRAKQIYSWLHKFGAVSFDEMSNISKDLRNTLDDNYFIPSCEIENKYVSKIDDTVKYLFRLYDGEYIESVIMKYKYGYTICVSSQVGCKMGCKFCASTLAGFKRNLSASEIEGQLHAPNDEIRSRTMPVNDKWNIDEVLKACKDYANKTNRRVSFEYTLIKDVNDTEECALELSRRLNGMLCHVNLIPVNNVEERKNIRSTDDSINKFMHLLKKNGINATIRRTLGSDINASCGQLRRKKIGVN